MATYIIGDVQGCFTELQQLLKKISFNPREDRLGFVGDLVNRGPDSLATLRFIKDLNNPLVVLGNHDLYLLMIGYDVVDGNNYTHTLQAILDAPDKIELLDWLRQQPLLTQHNDYVLVHAGIPPQFSLSDAQTHADEIHKQLSGEHYLEFLAHLFGNEPNRWQTTLTGQMRYRYLVNAFTRMRYCDATGELWLHDEQPNTINFKPWFTWPSQVIQQSTKTTILFGHWAALNGECDAKQHYALDTGCVWGKRLTALRLEDQQLFSVPAVT